MIHVLTYCIWVILILTATGNKQNSGMRLCVVCLKTLWRISLLAFFFYFNTHQLKQLTPCATYVYLAAIPGDVCALWTLFYDIIWFNLSEVAFEMYRDSDDPRGKPAINRYYLEELAKNQPEVTPRISTSATDIALGISQSDNFTDKKIIDIFSKPTCSRSLESIGRDEVYVKFSTFVLPSNSGISTCEMSAVTNESFSNDTIRSQESDHTTADKTTATGVTERSLNVSSFTPFLFIILSLLVPKRAKAAAHFFTIGHVVYPMVMAVMSHGPDIRNVIRNVPARLLWTAVNAPTPGRQASRRLTPTAARSLPSVIYRKATAAIRKVRSAQTGNSEVKSASASTPPRLRNMITVKEDRIIKPITSKRASKRDLCKNLITEGDDKVKGTEENKKPKNISKLTHLGIAIGEILVFMQTIWNSCSCWKKSIFLISNFELFWMSILIGPVCSSFKMIRKIQFTVLHMSDYTCNVLNYSITYKT